MKNTLRVRSTIGSQKREPVRPTISQIVRQAGLILIVLAIWSGLLVAYLNLTGKAGGMVSESPEPTKVVASPGSTQAPAPVEQPAATATAMVLPTAPPTTAAEATSVPTVLPTAPAPTEAPALPAPAGVGFSAEVLPILSSRCQRCHGGDRTEDELELLSYAAVIKGSKNGPVVIAGSSATSLLVQVIMSGKMPKSAPRLPDSEIQTIANWVDQGQPTTRLAARPKRQ